MHVNLQSKSRFDSDGNIILEPWNLDYILHIFRLDDPTELGLRQYCV